MQGSKEVAAQASSNAVPRLGMGTDTPAPEERACEVTEVADLTRTGAGTGPGGASQEPPKARAREIGHSEATVAPEATVKSAPGGKASTAPTGSSAGSQSSVGQLHKEWADTASSAGSDEARAGVLTLKELSK
jgi:hypothetical protein